MAARRRTHLDPYYRCELHCNHDLGQGMSVAELLQLDEYYRLEPPELPSPAAWTAILAPSRPRFTTLQPTPPRS